jgi:ribosomal protein S18 acetylase RimI-like enzyme
VAPIPSYFIDAERACPATTLYRSVQAHGVIESVDDPRDKGRVLQALMEKLQPEGGYVPIAGDHPLYQKALAGLWIARLRIDVLDGKAKLAQNRSAPERARILELLWQRGQPGDPRAIEIIRAANPDTPTPPFLRAPLPGATLHAALDERDLESACDLLADLYWNVGFERATLVSSHRGSDAWVGARDAEGRLVASARAVSDGGKHAWIYDVVVAPGWRGRGLGRALVRLVLDHPAVRRTRFQHLGTRDAMKLYQQFGFVDEREVTRSYTTTVMLRAT